MRLASRECPECGQRFSRDGVFCPFDGSRLESLSVSGSIDPLMGVTIDSRYEVLELLGEGGMGRVYSVLHRGLGRLFALKALRRELARDEELSQRFMREAKAMASVRHRHIVEITDFGRLPDGVPYFVMEMLVGETLAQVIKTNGSVAIARGTAILEQVASALAAAHEAGVVHRDLKPENVFLVGSAPGHSGPDDVRVVDFGAAKIIGASQVTRNGVVFGTPYYMSPEQASGSPVDTRTDIYSLGIIMYEMFTGKVPFEGDTYMNVLTQHMFAEPEPPSLRSAHGTWLGALDEVTLTCMAKKPERRYASMHEVLVALKAAAKGDVEALRRQAALAQEAFAPMHFEVAGDGAGQPSLEDIRRAVDGGRPPARSVPWAWVAIAAVGVGSAGGAIAWALMHPSPSAAPVPTTVPSAAVARSPPSTPLTAERLAATALPPSSVPVDSASAVGGASRSAPDPRPSAFIRGHVHAGAAAAPASKAPTPASAIDDVSDPFGKH